LIGATPVPGSVTLHPGESDGLNEPASPIVVSLKVSARTFADVHTMG
jgi:hypothetical protein